MHISYSVHVCNATLTVFSDAEWAKDADTAKAIAGRLHRTYKTLPVVIRKVEIDGSREKVLEQKRVY